MLLQRLQLHVSKVIFLICIKALFTSTFTCKVTLKQATYKNANILVISISHQTIKMHAYEKLPAAEKEKVRAILFIMDKFSISWEAYHELTQQDRLEWSLQTKRMYFLLSELKYF